MPQVDKKIDQYLGVLDNDYISASVTLVLIMYASLAAPKLPERVARVFDNVFVKLIAFFFIARLAKVSASVAAITAVGVMVSLQTLARHQVNQKMVQIVKQEVSASVSPVSASASASPSVSPSASPSVLPHSDAPAVEASPAAAAILPASGTPSAQPVSPQSPGPAEISPASAPAAEGGVALNASPVIPPNGTQLEKTAMEFVAEQESQIQALIPQEQVGKLVAEAKAACHDLAGYVDDEMAVVSETAPEVPDSNQMVEGFGSTNLCDEGTCGNPKLTQKHHHQSVNETQRFYSPAPPETPVQGYNSADQFAVLD